MAHRRHTWHRGTGMDLGGALEAPHGSQEAHMVQRHRDELKGSPRETASPAQPNTTWQPAAVQREDARDIAQVTEDLTTHTSRLSPSAMGSVLHPSETSLRVKKKHLCELYFLFRVALASSEIHAVLHVWAQ